MVKYCTVLVCSLSWPFQWLPNMDLSGAYCRLPFPPSLYFRLLRCCIISDQCAYWNHVPCKLRRELFIKSAPPIISLYRRMLGSTDCAIINAQASPFPLDRSTFKTNPRSCTTSGTVISTSDVMESPWDSAGFQRRNDMVAYLAY